MYQRERHPQTLARPYVNQACLNTLSVKHRKWTKYRNSKTLARPYVNQACLNTLSVKHRKWTKYRNSMTNRNYVIYKSARNQAKAELGKAKYEYEKDLASKIKTDNKLFWSYVGSKMKTKSSSGELEMPNGDLTSDSQEKADILNNFFVSVFKD